MDKECNMELEGEQNEIMNHNPEITINDKAKEILNHLENLIWKMYDLEELTPLRNMFWDIRTLESGVAERFRNFPVHVQLVVE